MTQSQNTIIYTDGASSGNPGPGGYAAVVSRGSKVSEIGGHEEKTTNNRMEMSAALFALKETEAGESITVYTDSAYLINGITKWVFGWQKNNWMTKDKKEVLNRDLGVMDLSAISLCKEAELPIIVFNLKKPDNMRRVVMGERVGTLIN